MVLAAKNEYKELKKAFDGFDKRLQKEAMKYGENIKQ